MLWFTALVGALVMVWADAAARTLFRPEELPIGILTASLGAPVFMWIISRKYKDY
jgi:iron complex transport system permease protein